MTDENLLLVNGVDGERGGYLPSPFAVVEGAPELHGGALDAASARERRWLKERYGLDFPDRMVAQGVDPLSLASSGWGLLLSSDLHPEVREQLQPLRSLRKAQAGDLYREFTLSPGITKAKFLTGLGKRSGAAEPRELPYYLLIVGDPASIPFRFQYELDVQYAVGRIHFDALEDYGRYARAVAAVEREEVERPARRLTFFAVDNDSTTRRMNEGLIDPLRVSLAAADLERQHHPWPEHSEHLADAARKSRLVELLGGENTPSLLLTGSHGVSFQYGSKRQRDFQGALVCQDWPGPSPERRTVDPEHYFAASDVPETADLSGLVVVSYACYSAGMPELADFEHPSLGPARQIAERPFISRLAQRLLSRGALALVGHVERSWTSTFTFQVEGDQMQVFEQTLKRLMAGHPVGSAMEFFNQQYAELSVELSGLWADREHLLLTSQKEFSRLWQVTNDARNFVVIGDPAVRCT